MGKLKATLVGLSFLLALAAVTIGICWAIFAIVKALAIGFFVIAGVGAAYALTFAAVVALGLCVVLLGIMLVKFAYETITLILDMSYDLGDKLLIPLWGELREIWRNRNDRQQ